MRIPASLHIVAGVGILLLLLLTVSVTEGKRTERNTQEDKAVKQETNDNNGAQKKPTIFSFIRGLFPNPERTLENLKAVAASSRPKAKSMEFTRNKNEERDSKNKKKAHKERTVTLKKKSGKPALGTSRLRLIPTSSTTTTTTTPRPKKVHQKKTSATTTTKVPPKTKSAKLIKDRPRTTVASASHVTPPAARDMVILTHDQKRDRLRQELVKETEDNCLAKILCGGGKPKPKDKNTFVSDSAYLIKEFFNIFDFTVDGVPSNDKKKEEEDEPQNDKDEDEEEDEDDETDDEEDEIYRKEQGDTESKKHATPKPKRPQPQQQTSQQPALPQKTRTSKPMATFLEKEDFQRRPKPVATTTRKTTTTTKGTTSTTIRPSSKEDGYSSILTGGDMAPFIHTSSKFNMMNKDRLGEAVTLSSNNILTNTMISTSVSGSATLKPLDYPFEIPLKTAKDDSEGDDDDEEDDNNKYDDDGSTYHRVTLEELVGDIKLTAADLAMMRRGRSMKVNVDNITPDRYIKSKLRQLKQVNNEVQKLRIAQKIGRSMREPRQCRQFNQVAQEVLQTCPLTTEVIRFFNTNLRNGTSVEVKKIPATSNSTGGGLVLLGNDQDGSQQTFLVDNNGPPSSNINLESDLKNPSIPSSYGKDEDQYHVYEKRPNPNPQHANLNQHGQDITKRPAPPKEDKEKEADSEEEQDDEGDSDEEEEEEEEDDVEGRRVEQNYQDDGGDDAEDEEDDDDYDDGSAEDDEDGSDDNSNNKIKIQGNHEQIQGTGTNQPNFQVAFRPKPYNRPKPQGPTLPPGIIRVYGVPQASFDTDFTTLADQLGPKPVTFFGEEDIDRPAYKRRRQLPTEDDEKEDLDNVAYSSRVPKHPPLESEGVNDGDDDDEDHITTKKPYKTHKKKHNGSNSGKPLGGLKGAGDDDDDDDDDHKKGGHSHKKKKKGHSIESVDLNESPFSTSGFYNPAQDYFHHHQQENYHHHHHPHHYNQGPHHHQYGYRPIVRPIQIIPDVQVPVPFRPTRANMRPGRLYPLYGKK